jgi:hypothetical protein
MFAFDLPAKLMQKRHVQMLLNPKVDTWVNPTPTRVNCALWMCCICASKQLDRSIYHASLTFMYAS